MAGNHTEHPDKEHPNNPLLQWLKKYWVPVLIYVSNLLIPLVLQLLADEVDILWLAVVIGLLGLFTTGALTAGYLYTKKQTLPGARGKLSHQYERRTRYASVATFGIALVAAAALLIAWEPAWNFLKGPFDPLEDCRGPDESGTPLVAVANIPDSVDDIVYDEIVSQALTAENIRVCRANRAVKNIGNAAKLKDRIDAFILVWGRSVQKGEKLQLWVEGSELGRAVQILDEQPSRTNDLKITFAYSLVIEKAGWAAFVVDVISAYSLAHQGKFKEARDLLGELASSEAPEKYLEDGAGDFYFFLATLYHQTGTPNGIEMAITYYHKAIAQKPDHWMAYLNRAEAYKTQGRYDDALADLTTLTNQSTLDPAIRSDAYIGLAWLQATQDRDQDALASFEAAIDLDPAKGLPERGHYWLERDQIDSALEDLERAITLAPTDPYIATWLIVAHLEAGDGAKAEAQFTQSREYYDENSLGMLTGFLAILPYASPSTAPLVVPLQSMLTPTP